MIGYIATLMMASNVLAVAFALPRYHPRID